MLTRMIEYIKYRYYRRLSLKHVLLAKKYDDFKYRNAYLYHTDVSEYYWQKTKPYMLRKIESKKMKNE